MTEVSRLLGCTIMAGGIAFTVSTGNARAQGIVPEPALASTQPPVAIQVDFNQTVGAYKPIYSWFGYDEANYTTMRHGKELSGNFMI